MTRLILLLALLPATSLAAPSPPAADIGKGCFKSSPDYVADAAASQAAPYHRLDQLPPANHQLALARSVDGCSKPVIVRYGIRGGAPSPVR